MKKTQHSVSFHNLLIICLLLVSITSIAQPLIYPPQNSVNFWDKVQFGGGLGLNFGSGYTNISVAPSMIYNINPIVAVGTSLQFGYVNTDYYETFIYGASLIGLVNPIEQLQLSAEIEQTRFNTTYEFRGTNASQDFWNTALYLGAGFRTQNVTIGIRYDVLYDKNKSFYAEPYMPFVRVYF